MNLRALAAALELDLEIVQNLVRTFVTTTERDLQELDEALQAGDSGAVARAAHHLKGAAATLELEAIRHSAEALEREAREGRLEGASALLQRLRSILLALRTETEGR